MNTQVHLLLYLLVQQCCLVACRHATASLLFSPSPLTKIGQKGEGKEMNICEGSRPVYRAPAHSDPSVTSQGFCHPPWPQKEWCSVTPHFMESGCRKYSADLFGTKKTFSTLNRPTETQGFILACMTSSRCGRCEVFGSVPLCQSWKNKSPAFP